MSHDSDRGFTLLEVLVAVVLLSVGVLTLLQSAAGVTRMLRDGRQRSRSMAIATTRLETMRQQAMATSPTCVALTSGSASLADGFTESWSVTGAGFSRAVSVAVYYPLGTSTGSQTVRTIFPCQ